MLTISKDETANKARDNYKTQNGQSIRMTDDEFRVKLNVEAHIDEIAETSIGNKNKTSDTKAHDFAKDGFTYRTAYFQDFDGEYYKIRLSIGHNGTVATVYYVGKINKDSLPSAKIIAVVGSKPLGKLPNSTVSQPDTESQDYSMQNSKNNTSKRQYLYGGENAETTNIAKLDEAESRIRNGEDSETVRQETEWFKGTDSEWRFEIDDSKMSVNAAGIEYLKKSKSALLGYLITHEELFKAYPELRDMMVYVEDFYDTSGGYYNPKTNTITLNSYIIDNISEQGIKEVLIHEIEHAVQEIEGFASGSSPEYWGHKARELLTEITSKEAKRKSLLKRINILEYSRASMSEVKRGQKTLSQHRKDLESFKRNSKYGEQIAALEAEIKALKNQRNAMKKTSQRYDLYERTAGEIEANDAANRMNYTDEQRKNTRPDIDRTDVVFAERGRSCRINPDFVKQLEKWDKKTVGFSFVIGRTSLPLQQAGIPDKQIRLDATKVKSLLNKHSGMIIDTVKKIPNLLENPIIVLDSKSSADSKIVMGDLYDENNKIVTVVLLLTPTSKKGNLLDIIKISSAEGRGHIQSLFTKADGSPVTIRYVDEKRVQDWLNVNRLQLPLHSFNLNSNNSISENNKSVNAENNSLNRQYYIDIDTENKKITPDMSESERAEILRNTNISVVENVFVDTDDIDILELENSIKSKAEKIIVPKLKSLGYLRNYTSNAISIDFDFTTKGLGKSLHSQMSYGGNYGDFLKAIVNLDELLHNSVLIESHTDKGIGTKYENQRLKQVYVLLSALKDGAEIIPVQFEIKEYINNDNRLYLAVAMTKIEETGVMGNTAVETNQPQTSLIPVSNISIVEIFKNINTQDKNFLKYIPDEFLNDEQIAAKKVAVAEDQAKYTHKKQQGQYSIGTDTSTMSNEEIQSEMNDIIARMQRGEITADEASRLSTELLNKAANKHGAIPKGENPKVDVTVPSNMGGKRKTRQHVRTILESGVLPDYTIYIITKKLFTNGNTCVIINAVRNSVFEV